MSHLIFFFEKNEMTHVTSILELYSSFPECGWHRRGRHFCQCCAALVAIAISAVCLSRYCLKRRYYGQIAFDNDAALQVDVIGKQSGIKGAAVRYKQYLFKVLTQNLAGDNIDQGLSTT